MKKSLIASGVLSRSVPLLSSLISARFLIVPVSEPLTKRVILTLVDAHGASGHDSAVTAFDQKRVRHGFDPGKKVKPEGI